ncbi:hypothetical protein [Enterovibrio norvegicus]|uniref:hypothetical protein n=1 Tax=Enterovibrio norvegicus TaxID=188144 RepID=UPI00352D54C9
MELYGIKRNERLLTTLQNAPWVFACQQSCENAINGMTGDTEVVTVFMNKKEGYITYKGNKYPIETPDTKSICCPSCGLHAIARKTKVFVEIGNFDETTEKFDGGEVETTLLECMLCDRTFIDMG